MKAIFRSTALTLLLSLFLTGCAPVTTPSTEYNTKDTNDHEVLKTFDNTDTNEDPTLPGTTSSEADGNTTEEKQPTVIDPEIDENGFTYKQRNSIAMLYHLSIISEEIRIAKNNRLILDDIHSSLLNDINPDAIDETTQEHLDDLRDIIYSYIGIANKRERLLYIYNQSKAASLRNSLPDPIAVLSMANSVNWVQLAVSAVFSLADSYTNYKNASDSAAHEYLTSGWELDDEESLLLFKSRGRAFDYMVDIVQEYAIDGKTTLNNRAIETFAEICAIDNLHQRIRRLESEKDTYKLLGNYWLELADSYYETEQYRECLKAVKNYTALSTGIFRKDYNYVEILPKAIVAAQKTYTGDTYVNEISSLADDILINTETTNWSLRYFAAQVYLDLYGKTEDREYLKKAYNIAYDNIAVLVDEQKDINSAYFSDVKEATIEKPDYSYMDDSEKKAAEKTYKEEKKRADEYNKALKESRVTELPSTYEPLALSCDLLFALAEKINISDDDKASIESILQTKSKGVFITETINRKYSFSQPAIKQSIELTKEKILIPVSLLSSNSVITVSVTDKGKTENLSDCAVTKVERKGNGIDTFFAHVSGNALKKYPWSAESKVTVTISEGRGAEPLTFKFRVSEYKDYFLFGDKVVFEAE